MFPRLMRDYLALLLLLSIAALLPVVVVFGVVSFLDLSIPKAAQVVGSIGTLVLVGLGGIFAIYQFRLFRQHAPHLSIEQSVTHHKVSENYLAIVVTVRLTNSSKVMVPIYDTLFRIQEFSELTDDLVEELYAQAFIGEEVDNIQWPTLDEQLRDWSPGGITIEPGETHAETYEFVIADHIKTIMVYSMFYNPYSQDSRDGPRGWSATSVYSIEKGEERQ